MATQGAAAGHRRSPRLAQKRDLDELHEEPAPGGASADGQQATFRHPCKTAKAEHSCRDSCQADKAEHGPDQHPRRQRDQYVEQVGSNNSLAGMGLRSGSSLDFGITGHMGLVGLSSSNSLVGMPEPSSNYVSSNGSNGQAAGHDSCSGSGSGSGSIPWISPHLEIDPRRLRRMGRKEFMAPAKELRGGADEKLGPSEAWTMGAKESEETGDPFGYPVNVFEDLLDPVNNGAISVADGKAAVKRPSGTGATEKASDAKLQTKGEPDLSKARALRPTFSDTDMDDGFQKICSLVAVRK